MRILLIASTLVFAGCISNDVLSSSTVAHQNVDRISRLQFGMTREEVYEIMRYPTMEDQITTDHACYDVWFYITRASVLGQGRPVARNLTPLIFRDGIFIGMGQEFYSQLVKKTKQPTLAPAKPEIPAAVPDEENIDLEKSLGPTPSSQPPSNNKEKKTLPETPKPGAPSAPAPVSTPTPDSPPDPNKPAKPVKKNGKFFNLFSMSSKPKTTSSPEPTPDASSDDDSSEPLLDERDREMLDREREENFNDW